LKSDKSQKRHTANLGYQVNTYGWLGGLKGFRKAGIRVKGDERILGDRGFVENVLKSAEEGLKNRKKTIFSLYLNNI
jgi:hypothetical protein